MKTTTIEITGTLELWCQDNVFPYIIFGNVYGDSKGRFRSGERISTSYVTTPVEEWKEGAIVKTRNSVYKLGTPYNPEHVLRPVEKPEEKFAAIEEAIKQFPSALLWVN